MSTIDRAVGNVLRQKVAAGLFDGNASLLYVDPDRQAKALNQPASRELARQVAEEGITLLANRAARLPLRGLGASIKKIAVVGPNADNVHSTLGIYGQEPGDPGTVTVLQAVVSPNSSQHARHHSRALRCGCLGGQAEAANASGNAFTVEYERGACLGGTPDCSCGQMGKGGWSKQVADTPQTQPVGPYSMPCDVTDESRVEKAAAVAAAADVTLLVIGDSSTLSTAKNATPYFREVRRLARYRCHLGRILLEMAAMPLRTGSDGRRALRPRQPGPGGRAAAPPQSGRQGLQEHDRRPHPRPHRHLWRGSGRRIQ